MANVLVEETSLTEIANSIREKLGVSDTFKPREMANAISSIESGGSGGDTPYLLDVTEYTHAEDWTTDTLGNANNFLTTYANLNDLNDYHLYIIYIENNTATARQGNYFMKQRYSHNSLSVVNSRQNWTNTDASKGASRSYYISAGAKITVIRFKWGDEV